jgi:uncharacterized protein YcbK (DUF882 family)
LISDQTSATICQASKLPPFASQARKRSFRTGVAAALLALAFTAATIPAHADTTLAPGEMGTPETIPVTGQKYTLKLHHLHTGEDIDIVYRIGDTYLPAAMDKLNYFLRDHRTEDASHYDPKEFDLLHNLLVKLNRPNGVVDILCGYRTPWSNNFLRTRGPNTGVAKNSQHTLAKAIDIRIPGVATRKLRDTALSLQAGGVGYYPVSQFVHVDVGPVRTWSFR